MANVVDKNEVPLLVGDRVSIECAIEEIDMVNGRAMVRIGGNALHIGTGTSNRNPEQDRKLNVSFGSLRKLP